MEVSPNVEARKIKRAKANNRFNYKWNWVEFLDLSWSHLRIPIIDGHHVKATKVSGGEKNIYSRARVDKRIILLRNFLPDFLVEDRNRYGIFSEDGYTLSEEEYLGGFPAVLLAIEPMLYEFATRVRARSQFSFNSEVIAAMEAPGCQGDDSHCH